MSSTAHATRPILALAAACLVFNLTALRDGHNWGGDFSQYILQAKNLVEGTPYAELDYVEVPGNPYNPQAYPPGLPFSLVPFFAAVGLNFWALKIPVVIYLALGVWAFGRLLPSWMPQRWALGCTAFYALSPWVLYFSNNILSDIPFVTGVILCLWAAELFFSNPPSLRRSLIFILAILFACSFRTVGGVLAIAVITQALLFRRTHIWQAAFVCFTALAVASVGYTYFECGATYFQHLSYDVDHLLGNFQRNFWVYRRGLVRFLALYPSRTEDSLIYLLANYPPLFAFLLLVIIGIGDRVRRKGVTYDQVFASGYITVILFYRWSQSTRYLLPIIPILLAHAFIGLRFTTIVLRHRFRATMGNLGIKIRHRLVPFVPALIYIPLFAAKWGYYALMPTSVGANVFQDPDVTALFAETRARASEIDGVIFNRPRVLRLMTDVRAGVCYNTPERIWDGPLFWDLAEENRISHILIGPHELALPGILEAHPDAFALEYQNAQYALYRMGPRASLSKPTELRQTKP